MDSGHHFHCGKMWICCFGRIRIQKKNWHKYQPICCTHIFSRHFECIGIHFIFRANWFLRDRPSNKNIECAFVHLCWRVLCFIPNRYIEHSNYFCPFLCLQSPYVCCGIWIDLNRFMVGTFTHTTKNCLLHSTSYLLSVRISARPRAHIHIKHYNGTGTCIDEQWAMPLTATNQKENQLFILFFRFDWTN